MKHGRNTDWEKADSRLYKPDAQAKEHEKPSLARQACVNAPQPSMAHSFATFFRCLTTPARRVSFIPDISVRIRIPLGGDGMRRFLAAALVLASAISTSQTVFAQGQLPKLIEALESEKKAVRLQAVTAIGNHGTGARSAAPRADGPLGARARAAKRSAGRASPGRDRRPCPAAGTSGASAAADSLAGGGGAGGDRTAGEESGARPARALDR